jgi:integrase
MSATQPIRNKHQIRELAEYYLKRGELRNHLLVVMGVHTALRISDLLRLTWEDVYDFERQRVRERVSIFEKKQASPNSLRSTRQSSPLFLCALPSPYAAKP